MANENRVGFNIKAVAERTGVPLHTLRAWERRYGIPRPNRHSANGYRLYDEQDIADVLWMKRQVQAGVAPSQASALLLQQPRERAHTDPIAAPPAATLQKALYQAFVQHDEAAAQDVLKTSWSAFGVEQVVLEIIQPTMRAIGDGWQRNVLSVEQEHFASNLVRQQLHSLIQAQPASLPGAPYLVAACAPAEQHDLGLAVFALLAKRQGWNVNYLGQFTPLAELEHAAEGARFVVISVSTVMGLASLVPLWSMPLLPAPLLFGGQLLNELPRLRAHLPGTFLGENSAYALQMLSDFTPRSLDWKPSPRALATVGSLDASRLYLAHETVSQYFEHVPGTETIAQMDMRHGMNHAALFLTDALVCALAFDTPELMDVQGAWSTDFMPPHRISLASLRTFLDLYTANCQRVLSAESFKTVQGLIERLMGAMEGRIQ